MVKVESALLMVVIPIVGAVNAAKSSCKTAKEIGFDLRQTGHWPNETVLTRWPALSFKGEK